MEQTVWLAFGAATLLVSWTSLASQSLPERVSQIGVMMSVFLWGYWSISATSVTQTSRCCVETFSYDGAAIFGSALGVVMFIMLIDSVWGLVGVVDG